MRLNWNVRDTLWGAVTLVVVTILWTEVHWLIALGVGATMVALAQSNTPVGEWVSGGYRKKCPECAENVRGDALVCRYCGHGFDEAGEVESEVETVCEACGAVVDDDAAVCPGCGQTFAESAQ